MSLYTITNQEIGFKIHKLVFLLNRQADKNLHQNLKITYSQVLILQAVKSRGAVSQRDIARYWETTDAAVSRQANILVYKGYIQKRENEKNRRQHILSLTPKGNFILSQSSRILENTFASIFEILDKSQKDQFKDCLDRLLNSICPNTIK